MKTWEKVMLSAKYMGRKSKPAIAMLVAAVMLLSAMPLTAFAADTHTTHCVCGGTAVGVGDHTSCTNIAWTELTQADFDNAGEDTSPVSVGQNSSYYDIYILAPGNYYLGEDITISTDIKDIWTEYGENTYSICLNGKTLNINERTIRLEVGAKLNICDCQGEGKITSQALALYPQSSNNVCNMYGGTVLNTDNNTWGVNVIGSFNMYGGAISGKTYGVRVNGNMNMYGGTVDGNTGIYVLLGTVTVRGGSITGSSYSIHLYSGDALRLSGSPNIANVIRLPSDKFITVDGALGNTTPYIIELDSGEGVFAKPDGTNVISLAAYESNFVSRYNNYVVAVNGNDLKLAVPHEHSYTYTGTDNVITENCSCGHEETATLNAPTGDIVYDGNAKQGATVTYSDGWLGGELTVTYSNNINAGEATASITKDGVTATAQFTINGATPSYTIPSGLTATYGDTLSQVALPSNWAWKTPSVTVGNVGSNSFKAIYTPTDTNYKAIETDVTVNVEKATPQYTVPMGVTATYGDTLAEIALSNWGSGWTWKDSSQSVGDVGTKTFKAIFTPDDTTNYETVEVDVTVSVSLAAPTYTAPAAKENLVYSGDEKTLVNADPATGGTMMYALGNDGTTAPTDGWGAELPNATDAGTYYVWYKVVGDSNHSDVQPVCIPVAIAKKQIAKPAEDNSTFIYNGNDQTYAINSDPAFVIANNVQKNAGSYTVTVTLNDTGNYEWADGTTAVLDYTFKIEQKELTVVWGNTTFTYNGNAQMPTATANGTVNGDQIALTVDGAQTNASDTPYTATVTGITGEAAGNYKLPSSVTTNFTIEKADQTAPSVGKTDETISKKADGTITAVDSAMEYRGDSEDVYTVITGNTVENLAAGKYYVRVKGDSNHNPSPETAVNIAVGRKLKINVPQNQVGYTLTSDVYEIDYLGSAVLTFALKEGYSESANFAIALNGNSDGQWLNDQMPLSNIDTDVNIVVEGVVDSTAPEAEIDIKGNKWTSFLNTVTFGLFFKETQDVIITAIDAGSGVNTIAYYVANDALTLDEVKAITDWEDYNGTFKINPDNKYVVYAKITDNAGNTLYVNSNGIVLDKTEAVVNGLVNGETYYGQLVFTVSDSLSGIDTVKIDGVDKTHFEGQYVINPDNQEHTVTATDKAGNVTEYKVTVYKNYTVTFKADGNIVHTETVGHGKDVTLPTIPAKEGYTQTAPTWDKDGKNITADTEITAVYTINKYTVTYKVDGQVVDTQTIEHGADATAPIIPAKEGYDQIAPAWDKDGKNITADTEITAVYTINKYTVTYKADGQVVETVTVEHGADATAPAIPTKVGYDQTTPVWDKDGKNITADTEITAVYTINKYTVTYKVDGQVVDTQTIEHGADATAPAIPTKEGYDQTAPTWDKDGKNITADTEITAVYTINKYTVTYKADGQVVETVTVEHGADATAPAIPTKVGYDQTTPVWDKDGKNITADTEITAVYTINKYTVTYKVDGQVVDTQTIEHGVDAIAPAIPTKEGYDQTAPTWDKDGKNITADTEIAAVYTINKYTVTYKADGQVVETVTVEHGADATAPAIPTKVGYDQTAPVWDKDGKNITADTEITAVYTINKYTVTYKADGQVVDTQTIEHGEDATAPAIPTKKGYDQTAPVWDKDGKNITADTEITAVYTINEYTITFMIKDGVYKTFTYKYGETVQMPNVPVKEGYTVKWETTIDKANGDAIVKAVYTEIPKEEPEEKTEEKPEEKLEEIPQKEPKSPKTGDNSNLWLWVVLALVSGVLLFDTILWKRKQEELES